MSIDAINWAWKQPIERFSAKYVLIYLADKANSKKGYCCWPAIATICRDTQLSQRTVQRSIRILEKHELIKVINSNGGQHCSNKYFLLLKDIQDGCQHGKLIESSTDNDVINAQNGVICATKTRHDYTQTINNGNKPNTSYDCVNNSRSNDYESLYKKFIQLENSNDNSLKPLIFKLTKEFGKDNLIYALEQVLKKKPISPKSYLLGVLKNKANNSLPINATNHQVQERISNPQIVKESLEKCIEILSHENQKTNESL